MSPNDHEDRMARAGLTLPIFGPLADPSVVAGLAAAAEEAGLDGVFVWDHVQYRRDPRGPDPDGPADLPVADPWVTMAAMATATTKLRLGPMVTPLPRRRPQVLARQAATLDLLSHGRLVLGVGLGGDAYGEFSDFGDEPDPRVRAAMLDQRIDLLVDLWSGTTVHGHDEHARADGVVFRPTPVQSPRPPLWAAGRWPNRAPMRRAARLDGWFPIDLDHPDDLAAAVAAIEAERGHLDDFDIVVNGGADVDPAPWIEAGATWWLTTFDPWHVTVDEVAAVIARGPATTRSAGPASDQAGG